MSDSLLLGPYECMGLPRTMQTAADGSTWALSRETGELGDPQIDTTVLDSVLLDGEPVTGLGSSNRTLTLALQVWASTEAGRRAGVTAIKQLVEQSRTFAVQWTPDPTAALTATKNLFSAVDARQVDGTVGAWLSSNSAALSVVANKFGVGDNSLRINGGTSGGGFFGGARITVTGLTIGQTYTFAVDLGPDMAGTIPITLSVDTTVATVHTVNVPGGGFNVRGDLVFVATSTTHQLFILSGVASPDIYAHHMTLKAGGDAADEPGYVGLWQGSRYTTAVVSLPAVMDCYRGVASVDWSLATRKTGFVRVNVTAPALPFMRSTTQEQITVSSTGPLLVSHLDTAGALISGGASGSGTVSLTADTTNKTEGTASNKITYAYPAVASFPQSAASASVIEITLGSTTDLSTFSALSFDMEIGANNAIPADQTVNLVLIDTSGRTRTLNQQPYGLSSGYFGGAPSNLQTGSHTLTTGISSYVIQDSGFDITAVAKVRFVTQGNATVYVNTTPGGIASSWWVNYDRLIATLAGGTTGITTLQGTIYTLPNIKGGARAPVAVQLHRTGGMSSIVLHRRPIEAPQSYTPLLPYMSDGTTAIGTFKNVPAFGTFAAGAGVRFNGTHAVWLAGVSLGGSGSRTITVTLRFAGGSHSDDVTFTRACQPSDVVNGLLRVDVPKTLPARAVPSPDATGIGLQYKVADSLSGATTVQDLLVLDTRGPTLVMTNAFAAPYVWLDAPSPLSGVGGLYVDSSPKGSVGSAAVAAFDAAALSGGPMSLDPLDPANNEFVVWCNDGPPDATFSYFPCWPAERLSA